MVRFRETPLRGLHELRMPVARSFYAEAYEALRRWLRRPR